MIPAGQRLRRFAARLCDEATMVTVIDPAIADLQHETEEARRNGDARTLPTLARYVALWQVLGYGLARSVIRGGAAGFASERALLTRTVRVAFAASLTLTVMLTLPPWLSTPSGAAVSDHGLLLLCLLPQAAAIGIPIAVSGAIVFAVRSRRLTVRVVGPLTVMALIGSGLTFTVLQWLVPEGNQAFRALVWGGQIERGIGELALTTLARRSDPGSILAFHVRLSLVAATITLTAPGLVVVRLFQRTWTATSAALVGLIAYYAVAWTLADRVGQRAPVLAAWGPCLLVLALAAGLVLMRAVRSAQRRP